MIKCACCKQFGHLIQECPRDPNYKTNHNFDEESVRLLKIKDIKKKYNDQHSVLTSQLGNNKAAQPFKIQKYDENSKGGQVSRLGRY